MSVCSESGAKQGEKAGFCQTGLRPAPDAIGSGKREAFIPPRRGDSGEKGVFLLIYSCRCPPGRGWARPGQRGNLRRAAVGDKIN